MRRAAGAAAAAGRRAARGEPLGQQQEQLRWWPQRQPGAGAAQAAGAPPGAVGAAQPCPLGARGHHNSRECCRCARAPTACGCLRLRCGGGARAGARGFAADAAPPSSAAGAAALPLYPPAYDHSKLSDEQRAELRRDAATLGYGLDQQHSSELLPYERPTEERLNIDINVLDDATWNAMSPDDKVAAMGEFQDFHYGIYSIDDSQKRNLETLAEVLRKRHVSLGSAIMRDFPSTGAPERRAGLLEVAEGMRSVLVASQMYPTEEALDEAIAEVIQAAELVAPELVHPPAPGADDDELLSQRELAEAAAGLPDEGVLGEVKLGMLHAVGHNEHASHEQRLEMVKIGADMMNPDSEAGQKIRKYMRLAQSTGLFDDPDEEEDEGDEAR